MKKIIFISILIINSCVLFSQEIKIDTLVIKKNVIGLDITFFVRQFLNFNSNYSYYFENPYMLIYKREFEKSAIRMGVKFSHSSNISTQNEDYENSQKSNSYIVGIGYERYIDFYKRWKLHFGVDGNWSYMKNVNISQYNLSNSFNQTTESNEFAVLPFLNIGFDINSRLTIVTETFVRFSYGFGKASSSAAGSQYNTKSKNNGFDITYIYPVNLTLLVKF